MNKEEIEELMEYNFEYLEAVNSEEIFGGDYTSSVDLKYANKTIERLQQENQKYKEVIDKAIEYIKYCQTSDDDIFPVIEAEKMIEILKGVE